MFISVTKLKSMRQEKGWSQEVLAKASGLSVRTIQRLESDGKASAETVLSIASVFDLSPKELQATSGEIEVNWSRNKILRNLIVLLIISGALITLMSFGLDPWFYINVPSILFVLFFLYTVTLITFGTDGAIKSIHCFKYLFTDEMEGGAKANYLATILKSQIKFTYAAAGIALLVGMISIHANHESEPLLLHIAYAINMLALFWAAVFSEVFLRPLAI
ncbi:MAG: helix-turn-helix transcriptional regulator, partial [Paraglaciecola sp.]|uniref:helix-turn-helix domain-containing protein n=1 Tax=Paraglaciecola sp. TaxID=1920173 RepID=UPI003298F2D3